MKDQNKTKAKLIAELEEMRQRVSEMQAEITERKLAEESLPVDPSTSSGWLSGQALDELDVGLMVHELQVHQIELEMQNEKLMQARAEVEESYRQYTNLYDFAPVGYLSLVQDGTVRKINLAGANLLGMEYNEMIQRRLGAFVSIEARPAFNVFFEKLLSGQGKETCELAFETKGNEPLWVRLEATCFESVQESRAVIVDITERKQAEEALRESEEKYRTIYDNAQVGLYRTMISDGKVLIANQRMAELWGYESSEDCIAHCVASEHYADPGTREKLLDIMREHGKFTNFEARITKRDGTIIWLQYSGTLFPEKGYFEGVATDITERVRADAALRESEEKHRLFFENSPLGIIHYSKRGVITAVNDSMVAIFSSSYEKLVGLNINEIPNKKFSKEVFKSLDGKPGYYEGAYSSYTGKKLAMIQAYWIPIFHDDEVQSGIGIVEDITERVRTEESLQESERQLQTLIDAMPDFVCFKDGAGRWLKANEASIRIFRLEDIDYQGKKDSELAELDSYLRGSFLTCKESDARAWKERPLLRVEETIPHPDGSVRVYDVIKVPVFHPGGERKGLVVLGRDITERVQAAESLKQSTEELTRLYRASGVLLASATPDLDSLAQTIVETILLEFEHTNCSLLLVQPGSQELNRLAVAGPYANEVSTGILRLDGSGLVPRAIRSGEIVNFPDVTVSPDYVPNWDAARSELAVPLKIDQRVIGVIDVQSVKPGAFNTNDERLMLTFAERAALALENARLFSEANRRLKRIGALHTIDKAISTSFDINMTAGVFLEQALTYLEVDAANILLFNPAIHTLECIGRKGFRTSALKYTDLRLGQDLAGQVALQREIKYIPDLQEDAEVYLASPELSGEEFVAYYGIPLVAKGVLKGVLEIFHRTPLSADDEWLMFLNALAGQAAIAIDNASMFTDLQRSNFELGLAYDSTLEGWARALELRDMETEGHSRRVTEMTMRLARAMGVSSEALVHIRRGALLHDIGKMGIPDSILFKSGKLDRGEWAIMHQHTIWAYKMLSPIAYLRPALDIPRYHHEKWDGSGYPQGLHGEQIPLAARIFAIVDVWDALTSNRPYREAWPEDKVIQYIREQSGVHFDPRVVDAFFAIIGKTK